jgi:hypothetical protein
VKKDDVQGREGTQARQRRQALLLRLDHYRFGNRGLSGGTRAPCFRGPGYDLYLCAQKISWLELCLRSGA